MSKDPGHLATINLNRNELALWVFSGIYGCIPEDGRTEEQAIADILALPDGANVWARCQRTADYLVLKLMTKFAPGLPS